MLKRYIKRLFCEHAFIVKYKPMDPNNIETSISKEVIVCVKCNKEYLNNRIEVK